MCLGDKIRDKGTHACEAGSCTLEGRVIHVLYLVAPVVHQAVSCRVVPHSRRRQVPVDKFCLNRVLHERGRGDVHDINLQLGGAEVVEHLIGRKIEDP
jgi:hypothetical protein